MASFGELSLKLLALGAPPALVARCHRAALDEIEHAATADALAGREGGDFGPIRQLLGRRIGSAFQRRGSHLAELALESYRDGWLNESAAAAILEARANETEGPDREALERMAQDERAHADLARDIVVWCFAEDPRSVGRALAATA